MKKDKRFNENGRRYQIKKLWDLHHEILRLALLGWKAKEIAEELNVTPATVSNCLNSSIAKRQLEIMRGARDAETLDVAIEIRRFAPEVFKMLQSMLRDENIPVVHRVKIGMDMLDRAGYGAPKIVEARHLHAHLTQQEIEELKQRAREAAERGLLIPDERENENVKKNDVIDASIVA